MARAAAIISETRICARRVAAGGVAAWRDQLTAVFNSSSGKLKHRRNKRGVAAARK